MLLTWLLPKGGPIWAEFVAAAIDKSLIAGALNVAANWDEVKRIHDEYMNSSTQSNTTEPTGNPNQVINVFDVNK